MQYQYKYTFYYNNSRSRDVTQLYLSRYIIEHAKYLNFEFCFHVKH